MSSKNIFFNNFFSKLDKKYIYFHIPLIKRNRKNNFFLSNGKITSLLKRRKTQKTTVAKKFQKYINNKKYLIDKKTKGKN